MNGEIQYRSDKLERDMRKAFEHLLRATTDDNPIYSRAELEFDIHAARDYLRRGLMNLEDLQRTIGTHNRSHDL